MGKKYGGRGGPCINGHPPERRGPNGCRDCHLESRRRRIQAVGGSAAYQRRYNPDGRKRYVKNWVVAAHRRLTERARHQVRASIGELRLLWELQNSKCALTGMAIEPGQAHLDHKVPVAIGGPHTIDNLQWVHPMANAAKNCKSTAEFQQWLLAAADALREKLKKEVP